MYAAPQYLLKACFCLCQHCREPRSLAMDGSIGSRREVSLQHAVRCHFKFRQRVLPAFYSSTLCETHIRHHSADGTTRGRVSRPAAGSCSSPAHCHAWRRQSTLPQFIVFVVVSTAICPVVIVVLVVCCCSCGVGASCQLGARHDQSDGRRPFPFSHAAPVDGDLCGRACDRPIATAPRDVQYAARDGTRLVRCRFATTAAATLYVERQCRRRTSAPKRWQCRRRPWP